MVIDNLKTKMDKSMEHYASQMKQLRVGRATASMVENLRVEQYGTMAELFTMATISTPDARSIVIQPWDASVLAAIEKGIQEADLGLSCNNDGSIIRIAVPPMTEETRKGVVKQLSKMTEDAKVSLRNDRRAANDDVKKQQKNGDISEDDEKRLLDQVQKLTDTYISKVDEQHKVKETEILQV